MNHDFKLILIPFQLSIKQKVERKTLQEFIRVTIQENVQGKIFLVVVKKANKNMQNEEEDETKFKHIFF